MKYLITLSISLFSILSFSFGQAPNAFKYQTIVRNADGTEIKNQSVKFQISILEGSMTGSSVYTENHLATTSEFGLAHFEIGRGQQSSGSMTSIDWGKKSHFLKIEVDKSGGNIFVDMGTVELLSVPYALYAESSGNDVTLAYKDSNVFQFQCDTVTYQGSNYFEYFLALNVDSAFASNIVSVNGHHSFRQLQTIYHYQVQMGRTETGCHGDLRMNAFGGSLMSPISQNEKITTVIYVETANGKRYKQTIIKTF